MKIFFFTIFLFSILSCTNNNGNGSQGADKPEPLVKLFPTYDSLQWEVKVDNAIDSFLKETQCDSCINEIYINKIFPDSILITLKTRVYAKEYMKQNNSLFSTKIHGKVFYIFSGLEDVLRGNKRFLPMQGEPSGNKYIIWTLGIHRDQLTITKGMDMPFFPSTPVRFR